MRKSVAYNYACMLLLLLVQNSNDVRMLENHGAALLSACKADDNNPKLQGKRAQTHSLIFISTGGLELNRSPNCSVCPSPRPVELSKWLEPLEKLRFDISAIPTLIDYIKQVSVNSRHSFGRTEISLCPHIEMVGSD